MAGDAETDALLPNELVDSRALEATSDDRFRHTDLVAELAELVCTVPAPANVALFAPWGSGKSGMGNLLATRLTDRRGVRFVRFDASKYGQAPLRRHFISQVAKELGQTDDAFSRDLYRNVEERDVKFPTKELLPLIGAFLLTLLVVVAALCAVALFVAAVSSGGVGANWSRTIKDYLLPALPLAAIGAIFVKLATGGIVVNATRSAPSGDEEFERLFRRLVEKTKAQRIVVFVDELDRCSPAEVASTLETIKTFLEVEKCVFIVAADHQVLEQALRKKARQETPVDPTNPYYSAGSSYLDKIFQYQYQLPPLKPRRLTGFALELVRDREGVWQRVENLPEAVSVLIPTHVTSPRRVKVLLNSFALTYRLAERRASEGVLDSHLPTRASEIAKLVCLRCEFPLFAEDLSMDTRLPSLVRALADEEEITVPVRPEIHALAREYARGLLPVAELLIDESPPSAQGDDDESEAPLDEEGSSDEGELESPRESDLGNVGGEHAKQLVRYLRKVAYIPGPAADLIYLESAGAQVGLEPEVADDLERAAVDGDQALVLDLVTPLDEDGRRSAVWLLAGLVQEAPVGVDGQNVLSTLLGTISHTTLKLEQIAGDVANAVAGHQSLLELRPQDFCGALILGLASGAGVGSSLRDEVLGNQEALEREDVASTAVRGAVEIPAKFDPALGVAAATLLLGGSESALETALLSIPDAEGARVLGRARTPVSGALQKVDADDTSDDGGSEGGEDGPSDKNELVTVVATRLDSLMKSLGDNDRMSAMAAAATLALRSGQVPVEQASFKHLSALAPIRDSGLYEAVLDIAPGYISNAWTNQLGSLDVPVLKTVAGMDARLGAFGSLLWRRAMFPEERRDSPERRAAGLAALKRLIDGGVPVDRGAVADAVSDSLSGPFPSNADIDTQDEMLAIANEFVAGGLLDGDDLADIDLRCCVETLRAGGVGQPETERVPQALYARILSAIDRSSVSVLDTVSTAIAESQWLSVAQQATLPVLVAGARRRRDPETPPPLSAEQVGELHARDGEAFDPAFAEWIRVFEPSSAEIWVAIGDMATGPLPDVITSALRERSSELSARDKFELARPALEDSSRVVGAAFLRAINFAEADQSQAAAAIARTVDGTETTAQQWETAMTLWGVLAPAGQPTQERLINSVYLPVVQSGHDGVNIAISHFGLVSHQRGKVRNEIMNALVSAAADDDQRKRIEGRLKEAGWLKRGGILGLGSLQKTDEDTSQGDT